MANKEIFTQVFMDNNEFYTKGDRENVLSRINQVHTITMFCPVSDFYVQTLKSSFDLMLSGYKVNDNEWHNIPTIDAFNAFLFTKNFNDKMGIPLNMDIFNIMVGALKLFERLKRINFKFTDDPEVSEAFKNVLERDKEEMRKRRIYHVDMLEINLADMFSQGIIDILNKVFICNDLIPNSYLKRKFNISFSYDEYVSFMDMFINNNAGNLNMLDKNICDYFRSFPPLVEEQKPDIRLITNYSDL